MPDTPQRPFVAVFTFDAELNDFLPAARRNRRLSYAFDGKPAIKNAIEAQGVPHTEVDLIVANGASVGFTYHLRHGDQVAVYPTANGIDITPVVDLREKPSGAWRFILDVHLGKLARLLRLLGFDALYRNDYEDPQIVQVSVNGQRAVLTRDRRLLHARVLAYGYWIRSTKAEVQLAEVMRRFDLQQHVAPFSRCLVCNGEMESVAKEQILDLIEPRTQLYFHDFWRCTGCGKIYWQGSHFAKLVDIVEQYGNMNYEKTCRAVRLRSMNSQS